MISLKQFLQSKRDYSERRQRLALAARVRELPARQAPNEHEAALDAALCIRTMRMTVADKSDGRFQAS